jgi:glycosyltransferase involved in cell wall biosynthesis
MKALFVSNDPLIFVADSAVRARMRAYAALMEKLHIISAAPAGAEFMEDGNLFLYPVTVSKLMRIPALVRKARAVIRAHGIDVVSAQDPFEHGLAALLATLRTGAKRHIQIHTDFLSPYFARESFTNRLRLVIAALTLRTAHGIRVVSERVRDSVLRRYGNDIASPSVIPVALSAVASTPVPLPPNSFMFSLLSVSRLEREKHIEDILSALVLVRRKYQNVGLFIAGSGSQGGVLKQKVEALGLSGNVIFLGSRADARGLMKSAQAFVQASAHEGYALTLIEAALAGVAIATTDVGVVGNVLQPEVDVLVSPPEDPEALGANILRLIENNTLRTSLGTHAKKTAEDHARQFAHQPQLIVSDLARALTA